MGAVYYAGNHVNSKIPAFGQGSDAGMRRAAGGARSRTSNHAGVSGAGEFLWGAFVWLALLSTLNARKTNANRALDQPDSRACVCVTRRARVCSGGLSHPCP